MGQVPCPACGLAPVGDQVTMAQSFNRLRPVVIESQGIMEIDFVRVQRPLDLILGELDLVRQAS